MFCVIVEIIATQQNHGKHTSNDARAEERSKNFLIKEIQCYDAVIEFPLIIMFLLHPHVRLSLSKFNVKLLVAMRLRTFHSQCCSNIQCHAFKKILAISQCDNLLFSLP